MYESILLSKDEFIILADNSRGIYIPKHVMGLFGIDLDMNDEFYDEDFEEFEDTVRYLLRPYGKTMGYNDNGDYLLETIKED